MKLNYSKKNKSKMFYLPFLFLLLESINPILIRI